MEKNPTPDMMQKLIEMESKVGSVTKKLKRERDQRKAAIEMLMEENFVLRRKIKDLEEKKTSSSQLVNIENIEKIEKIENPLNAIISKQYTALPFLVQLSRKKVLYCYFPLFFFILT